MQRGQSPKTGTEAGGSWSIHPDHQAAVDRQRRIVVQYDPGGTLRQNNKIQEWTKVGFQYFDQLNSQVDAIWWDYDPRDPIRYRIPADMESDPFTLIVEETHRRGLEAFWNQRISVTDGMRMDQLNPIKAEHPDWVIKTWWWQGLWNLAVPEVRDFKVELLRGMAERYDFDGYQIDFSRHIPVLPIGR